MNYQLGQILAIVLAATAAILVLAIARLGLREQKNTKVSAERKSTAVLVTALFVTAGVIVASLPVLIYGLVNPAADQLAETVIAWCLFGLGFLILAAFAAIGIAMLDDNEDGAWYMFAVSASVIGVCIALATQALSGPPDSPAGFASLMVISTMLAGVALGYFAVKGGFKSLLPTKATT